MVRLQLRGAANVDARKLRDFFDNYGGSARTVYRSRNDMRRADYEDAVMAAVEDMDINLLHKLNSVEDKSSNQRFKNASSKLFIVRRDPKRFRAAHADVVSGYVFLRMMAHFAKQYDAFAENMIRLLKAVPQAGSTRGLLFEVVCHKELAKSSPKPLVLTEMESTKHRVNTRYSVPSGSTGPQKELHVRNREMFCFMSISFIPKPLSVDHYYVLTKENNATFDSFLVSDDELYVFQMASGKKHGTKEAGLILLNKIMVDRRINNWNFVYVFPESGKAELDVPNTLVEAFDRRFRCYCLELKT